MAMQDWKSVYSRIFWKNKREGGTPLNEANLNTSDIALKEIDNRILELRDAKFNSEDANGLVKDWNIDVATGIITVTWQNNTTEIYDLNIEKIPVNFEMSQDGIITMTTEDGSEYTADIKSVIPIYSFVGSATINVVSSVGESGEKIFTFSVVDGSIDRTKLNPDYLAEINTSVNSAQWSEQKSLEYSLLSKEYAEQSKASEVKSKEYMEKTFSGTPSGYSALVDKVEELNSNLDTLEFGEVAGGKNLFKGDFIKKVLDPDINYTDIDLSKEQNPIKNIEGITFVVFGAYLKKGTYTFSYTNDAYFSLNRVAIAGTDCVLAIETIRKSYTWTQNTDGWTYFGIKGDDSETGVTDTPFSVTPDIQIEKGAQATAYETYIPSIKMLAEEVSAQNKSLGALGKCKNLLNPTFNTATHNGVTFTRNDDGTCSLSGSRTDVSDTSYVTIINNLPLEKGRYKLTGALDENNYIRCIIKVSGSTNRNIYDYGNGVVFDVSKANTTITLLIVSNDDTSQTRIIKPMITTNLSATYDYFVPYTGDGDTLTHDVSAIKADLSDEWTSKTYSVGDYCIYKNSMWRCLVANSVAPSEGSNWTRVTIGSELKRIIAMIK